MSTVPLQTNPASTTVMPVANPAVRPTRPASAPPANTAPTKAPAVAATAAPATIPEEQEDEEGGFLASIKGWAVNDAPPMLISTIVHTVVFLALALTLGNSIVEKPKDTGIDLLEPECPRRGGSIYAILACHWSRR